MSATTLTDRYVWAVSRQLPPETGPDVARELRATLADTIEDKVAAGLDPDRAEREAITELGDPDVLARGFGGRPNHLLGPRYYADWVRIERMLLTVVLPIVVVVSVFAEAFEPEATLGSVIGSAVVVGMSTALHMLVWPTLAFALVERHGSPAEDARVGQGWRPEQLTDPDAPWRRPGLRDVVVEAGFGLVVAVLFVWQFSGVGEHGVQVFDPALAAVWKVTIVALLLAQVVLTVLAWARGGWTVRLAVVNAVLDVATGALLVWLLLEGRLLTDLPTEFAQTFGWGSDWSVSEPAVAIGIIVVCAWDAVQALLRVRRARRAERFLDQKENGS